MTSEERCEDCGGELSCVCISTDADGNRPEMVLICKECGD